MSQYSYKVALHDFQTARQKAALEGIVSRLSGKPNDLLSYEDIARKLRIRSQIERGVRAIPVKAIVGSVGRCTDFSRTFLPRNSSDQERWARVKSVFLDPDGDGLPPIDVYKVGDAYFVLDGNHRVSIARQEGVEFIDAHVIEMQTLVPMDPSIDLDQLIIKAEQVDFLEATNLHSVAPKIDFSVSVPGQYDKLLLQIEIQQYLQSQSQTEECSLEEAAHIWFDEVFSPVYESISERGLMKWFPSRTATDMFIWISEYRKSLEKEVDWEISTDEAMSELAMKSDPSRHRSVGAWREERIMDRYTEELFTEILVPISGETDSWQAVRQALIIGKKEGSRIKGLYIQGKSENPDKVVLVREQFDTLCLDADVKGQLYSEVGEIEAKILQRAALSDLVVLRLNHPPQSGLAMLGSSIHSILSRAARPVLIVPGDPCEIDRLLLLFDGSARAKEALFVATYLAEKWNANLTVFSALEGTKMSETVQGFAHAYLDIHEVSAEYLLIRERFDKVLNIIKERSFNLVIMGGYSGPAFTEMLTGSTVDFLLRELDVPILICS